MCANYTIRTEENTFREYFDELLIDNNSPFDEVRESVFPFTFAPVVIKNDRTFSLTAKRYSLTPSWAKTPKVKWATYNARMNRPNAKTGKLEYIYEVPTWKESFSNHHCLVPMNDFKESCHEGAAAGHIVKFEPTQSGALLFAAGLYSDWVDKATGEVLSTFAVVTHDPDKYISSVGHDRSPVFLSSESGKGWLNSFESGKEAYEFLIKNSSRPKLNYELDRKLKSAQGQ